MNSKSYFLKTLSISFLIVAGLIFINFYIDIFGLFHNTKGESIKIYTEERTAKYLLSYNYIPQNFQGIIVGPSLSDNLNTKTISDFKIYNASMMAANISELNYLIYNIVRKGKLDFVIFCLDPYITKDHGKKSSEIDKKQYYGAFGSTTLFKTYLFKIIREYNLMPDIFPKDYINSFGFYNYTDEFDKGNAKERILQKAKEQPEPIYIDSVAFKELDNVLNLLRKKKVNIVAYFTPVPYQILHKNERAYRNYQDKILSLFEDNDIVLDFTKEEYKRITSDYNTFIDHGHLSEQGQQFVLDKLTIVLKNNFEERQ